MSVEMQVIDQLKEAFHIMESAAYQSHSNHWDPEGTHGENCPECIRANDLRCKATNLFIKALSLLEKVTTQ